MASLIPVKKTVGTNRAASAPSGTFTKLSTGEIIRPSSVGGTAGTVSAVPASVSAAERAGRTLEANARKGASASNTAAAAKPPDYRLWCAGPAGVAAEYQITILGT